MTRNSHVARNLFPQNKIALVWDFDRTLIPDYMQRPVFQHFGVNEARFWDEVDGLPAFHRARGAQLIARDSIYLIHLLSYVRAGLMRGLNNQLLRDLGAQIGFFPGLPEFFQTVKDHVARNDVYRAHEIGVEHYIISTGLRQMILGSAIAPYVDGVWGCEFFETVAQPGYLEGSQEPLFQAPPEVVDVGYVIDNTTKTRALFEINKGSNKHPEIDVNASIPLEDRRVPFQNMIYVADGPSDIPVFSVLNQQGGKTFAVYKGGSVDAFVQVNELQKQGRVQSYGEANYTEGAQTYLWILTAVDEIATRIVQDRAVALGHRVRRPPVHLSDEEQTDLPPESAGCEVETPRLAGFED